MKYNKKHYLTKETEDKHKRFMIGNKFRLGIKNSKKTRLKISVGNIGKEKSQLHKEHLSKAIKLQHKINPNYGMKGKKTSEETKERIRLTKIGKNNPAWLGGKSYEPYNKYFNKQFKTTIRKRDNQICMNCGIHREKLKRALHIHHINYNKQLSIKENCISLCNSCHILTNKNREYWTKLFQDKLNKLYNYRYLEEEIIIKI